MTTVNDIFTKINQLIAAQFADVPIYINFCPNGFHALLFSFAARMLSART
jgi:hypothetical protein